RSDRLRLAAFSSDNDGITAGARESRIHLRTSAFSLVPRFDDRGNASGSGRGVVWRNGRRKPGCRDLGFAARPARLVAAGRSGQWRSTRWETLPMLEPRVVSAEGRSAPAFLQG